ncbi:MAG TPA: TIGR03943 family protein [Chloroflexota bacterium]|nr:TIGR03943 family protein [Chloroflexota bacterium]
MTIELEQRVTRVQPRLSLHRILPPVLLAGYGILILSLYLRHVLAWYINPTYIVPTVAAAGVLLALSVVGREDACDDGCTCTTRSPLTYGLLALPLVLGLAVPPHSLAAFSARLRGPEVAGLTVVHGIAVKRVSLSVDTRSFSIEDWAGALSADPNPHDYLGKPVQVTGMVLHDSAGVPPGDVMVMRYLITCCIADARPIGVVVHDPTGALKDNEWVTVTGKMGEQTYQGQAVSVVMPSKVLQVKAGNPYIY